MNKQDLIDIVAESVGLQKTQAAQVLETVISAIQESLKKGEEVRLSGLGTFKRAHRKASTGRNPRTGEEIQIAASNRVKFTSGKELKEAVNR